MITETFQMALAYAARLLHKQTYLEVRRSLSISNWERLDHRNGDRFILRKPFAIALWQKWLR